MLYYWTVSKNHKIWFLAFKCNLAWYIYFRSPKSLWLHSNRNLLNPRNRERQFHASITNPIKWLQIFFNCMDWNVRRNGGLDSGIFLFLPLNHFDKIPPEKSEVAKKFFLFMNGYVAESIFNSWLCYPGKHDVCGVGSERQRVQGKEMNS